MTTLLIAEHDNASIKDSTNKALTAAAALGAEVHVLVAGENAKAAADAAAKLAGVKKVLLADGAAYAHDLAEPLAALIVALAPGYDAFVAPATSRFKNVMPRVAALRANIGLSAKWRSRRDPLLIGPMAFQSCIASIKTAATPKQTIKIFLVVSDIVFTPRAKNYIPPAQNYTHRLCITQGDESRSRP